MPLIIVYATRRYDACAMRERTYADTLRYAARAPRVLKRARRCFAIAVCYMMLCYAYAHDAPLMLRPRFAAMRARSCSRYIDAAAWLLPHAAADKMMPFSASFAFSRE